MTDTAPRPPAQLALDLSQPRIFTRDDFIMAPANEAALRLVDTWPEWPSTVALLVGPAGCGKTHLAELWANRAAAQRFNASAIGEIGDTVRAALVEDVGAGIDETGLFHLINAMKAAGGHVLLTCERLPGALPLALADLRSRLAAGTVAEIGAPDDTLLTGLIAKLFADRQLAVEPDVVAYVAQRIERSTAAARATVDALDALALARKARITRALAAAVLKEAHTADEPELF